MSRQSAHDAGLVESISVSLRPSTKAMYLLLLLFSCSAITFAQAKKNDAPKPAQSIPELRQQIQKILQDSHTPGVSIAIVHRDGPEWVTGLGVANVATSQPATDETLFRIGSISKGFVSLSILKLVREGKLSLLDPVHKLVPEIWFENRWETTDPVRVVDLLEHTTGWDDIGSREYAADAKGWTIRQGLDYDHHSRISRWPPGTRFSYCNSGPAVAAYIVEKITGQRFEDYVTQNFFAPIGMKTATYFEQPSPQLATLYHDDGRALYPYWNILDRPSGAINASAQNMAAYLRFYLNRGTVGGTQITPAADIDRMERPTRTWAAQQGLKAGYGLNNNTDVEDGFIYHGHDGGIPGCLSEMDYLPEFGVGYYYSINSGNDDTFDHIGNAIRAYITRSLPRPPIPPPAPLPVDAQAYAGWYESATAGEKSDLYAVRLALQRVRFDRGNMVLVDLAGDIDGRFAPVADHQFRDLPDDNSTADPIATDILLAPNAEGRFINIGATTTFRRIPTSLALTELVLAGWFVAALACIALYAPIWLIGGLWKKRRRPAERAIRLWPLVAVLSVAALCAITYSAGADDFARLGTVTPWSIGIFLTTLVFAIATLSSAVALFRTRNRPVRQAVRWFSIAVTVGLLIGTAYFAYWGDIGLRTWL